MGSGFFDEVWSYTLEQIEEFLRKSGFEKQGDAWRSAGVCITAEPEPDYHTGLLTLPRVRVRMQGPGAEAFHHAFLLHFLSGGG